MRLCGTRKRQTRLPTGCLVLIFGFIVWVWCCSHSMRAPIKVLTKDPNAHMSAIEDDADAAHADHVDQQTRGTPAAARSTARVTRFARFAGFGIFFFFFFFFFFFAFCRLRRKLSAPNSHYARATKHTPTRTHASARSRACASLTRARLPRCSALRPCCCPPAWRGACAAAACVWRAELCFLAARFLARTPLAASVRYGTRFFFFFSKCKTKKKAACFGGFFGWACAVVCVNDLTLTFGRFYQCAAQRHSALEREMEERGLLPRTFDWRGEPRRPRFADVVRPLPSRSAHNTNTHLCLYRHASLPLCRAMRWRSWCAPACRHLRRALSPRSTRTHRAYGGHRRHWHCCSQHNGSAQCHSADWHARATLWRQCAAAIDDCGVASAFVYFSYLFILFIYIIYLFVQFVLCLFL